MRSTPWLKGGFLWSQFVAAKKAGASKVYVAMFDEVDKGTAIFNCTNNPPVGENPFVTYEGLPSGHYCG
jgi:predicted deacylase